MQVTTTDGITITLTDEQIAQIDSQVKAKQQMPVLITDRVKSWEDASTLVKPKWHISPYGTIQQYGGVLITTNYVSSEKRAKSLAAYAKLSVIADALNEGWEPGFKSNEQKKYSVYMNANVLETCTFSVWQYVTIYFKTRELAQYTITQFSELWKQYFMVD